MGLLPMETVGPSATARREASVDLGQPRRRCKAVASCPSWPRTGTCRVSRPGPVRQATTACHKLWKRFRLLVASFDRRRASYGLSIRRTTGRVASSSTRAPPRAELPAQVSSSVETPEGIAHWTQDTNTQIMTHRCRTSASPNYVSGVLGQMSGAQIASDRRKP
jgi:hypothetical protein